MPNNERPRQSQRPQPQGRNERPQEGQAPRQQTQHAPAPIRKKGSNNAVLAVVILIAIVAVVVLGVLVLPGACSRVQDGGDGEISVINTEGSTLSEEEIIDRAKERYAGTWVISSVTWQGEEGDGTLIPQKVEINVDGSCTVTQDGADYKGNWEIDGDSLYVTADGNGTTITKVLSIDDTNLNISTNNGTGVYVRTSKPDLSASDSEK